MSLTLDDALIGLAQLLDDGLGSQVVVSPTVPSTVRSAGGHLVYSLSFTENGATFCKAAASITLVLLAPAGGDFAESQRWAARQAMRVASLVRNADVAGQKAPKVLRAEPGQLDIKRGLFGVRIDFAPMLVHYAEED
ncbi:MAG: hypothetical protein AAFP84_21645 [Actinomycetota bacterium]